MIELFLETVSVLLQEALGMVNNGVIELSC